MKVWQHTKTWESRSGRSIPTVCNDSCDPGGPLGAAPAPPPKTTVAFAASLFITSAGGGGSPTGRGWGKHQESLQNTLEHNRMIVPEGAWCSGKYIFTGLYFYVVLLYMYHSAVLLYFKQFKVQFSITQHLELQCPLLSEISGDDGPWQMSHLLCGAGFSHTLNKTFS